jgi:hypothetical protein
VLSGDTGGCAGDVTRVGLFARGTESGDQEQLKSKYWEGNGRRARRSFKPVVFLNTGGVREHGVLMLRALRHTVPGFVILTSAHKIMHF